MDAVSLAGYTACHRVRTWCLRGTPLTYFYERGNWTSWHAGLFSPRKQVTCDVIRRVSLLSLCSLPFRSKASLMARREFYLVPLSRIPQSIVLRSCNAIGFEHVMLKLTGDRLVSPEFIEVGVGRKRRAHGPGLTTNYVVLGSTLANCLLFFSFLFLCVRCLIKETSPSCDATVLGSRIPKVYIPEMKQFILEFKNFAGQQRGAASISNASE